MSATERLMIGHAWERELRTILRTWGWISCPYGQGQLDRDTERVMRRFVAPNGYPSFLRWLPDLVARRDERIVLVDAKTEIAPSTNVAIETDALHAGMVIEHELNTPVLYVWREGCATPTFVAQHHDGRREAQRGSGTPFVIMAKSKLRPLAELFG